MFIAAASIFWQSAILREARNSTTTTILSSLMSGLNTMAAFALSVNRNKLFLECNAWHDLRFRKRQCGLKHATDCNLSFPTHPRRQHNLPLPLLVATGTEATSTAR